MLEMRAVAPMVKHWVRQMDDLPTATTDILRVIGDVYRPLPEENGKAFASGQDQFKAELLRQP